MAAFDLIAFQCHALGEEGRAKAAVAVCKLAELLNWPSPNGVDDLEAYLFERLTGWAHLKNLFCASRVRPLTFRSSQRQSFWVLQWLRVEPATQVLLALSTFAREPRGASGDGRVLMPTRLHLFFRGLPASFICSNPKCTQRRADFANTRLGRMYTQPLLQCDCGGRTYELLTHRKCGTAFLRGFLEGQSGTFLWHEPSGLIGSDDQSTQRCEVQLSVESPHADAIGKGEVVDAWLDGNTGRLAVVRPARHEEWLHVFLPALGPSNIDPREAQSFNAARYVESHFGVVPRLWI